MLYYGHIPSFSVILLEEHKAGQQGSRIILAYLFNFYTSFDTLLTIAGVTLCTYILVCMHGHLDTPLTIAGVIKIIFTPCFS